MPEAGCRRTALSAATRRRSEKRFEEFETMINGKRIAVVMPAYNAEKTLEQDGAGTV